MKRRTLLLLASAFTYAYVAAGGGLTLKTQLSDGWLVEYRPEIGVPSRVVIEGKEHLLFSDPGDIENHSDAFGLPMLPVETIILGVPDGATLHVELLDSTFEVDEKQDVAPIPDYITNDKDERVAVYRKNTSAYGRNDFYPAEQLIVDPPSEYRDQRIASFRMSPYQYNPATRTLRRLVGAKLKIELRMTDGSPFSLPQSKQAIDDPFFEETFKQLLWNYEQAKGWRLSRSQSRLRIDPRRDWFETGKAYYKMPITENGWHRVTRAQLVAAGALASQIDIPTLKIFFKGNEIPIVVRPDTTVEFFALRNRTDSTYFDTYTDTSAYWLTWGGTQGQRYASSFVDSIPPIQNVQTAYTTKHFEENGDYFYGITDSEIIDPEVMPGEGWIWGRIDEGFFPGTTKSFPFLLENSNPDTLLPVLMSARFVSSTQSATQPNHRVQLRMNSSPVPFGDTIFNSRTSVILKARLPSGLLSSGEDTLVITSVSTNTIPNKFFLDWFEFEYSRTLRASDNRLEISYPAAGGFRRVNFTVTGFTSPQIEVYDVQAKRRITSIQVANINGEYVATFRDTLSTARQYVIVAPGAARSPAAEPC